MSYSSYGFLPSVLPQCPSGSTWVTAKSACVPSAPKPTPSYAPAPTVATPAPAEELPVAGAAGGLLGGDTLMWAAGGLLVATVSYVIYRRRKAS